MHLARRRLLSQLGPHAPVHRESVRLSPVHHPCHGDLAEPPVIGVAATDIRVDAGEPDLLESLRRRMLLVEKPQVLSEPAAFLVDRHGVAP